MNGQKMPNNQRIIAYIIAGIAVVAIISMWFSPGIKVAEAAEFNGDGAAYSGASSSQSTTPPSSIAPTPTPKPESSSSSQEDSEVKDMLSSIRDSINKMDNSLQPDEYADVETPEWVKKGTDSIRRWTAIVITSLQYILFGTSGAWYAHCMLAIFMDSYFNLFCGFKFSFFGKHLYEVKAMAGVYPQQRQQSNGNNGGYGNNGYGNNNNYGNNNYGNNQQYNQQNNYQNNQQSNGNNGQPAPGIFKQIGIFTFYHIRLLVILLIVLIAIKLGWMEKLIIAAMSALTNIGF